MENLMKVCSKCKVKKGVGEFGKNNSRSCGLDYYCKLCKNQSSKDWVKNNLEKRKNTIFNYYHKNIEYNTKRGKDYRQNNKEKELQRTNNWKKLNPEKVKIQSLRHRIKYPEQGKSNNLEQVKNLPDCYIRKSLKKSKYPQELINNPEFIEVKRLIIKTQRLCRTSQI